MSSSGRTELQKWICRGLPSEEQTKTTAFFRRVAFGLSALWITVYLGSGEEATQRVAFKALTELTASSCIGSLLSPYAQDGMGAVFMGVAPWIHTLFNLPFRYLESLGEEGSPLQRIAIIARFLRHVPLEVCVSMPIVTFIHEMGHAQMGRLLFKDCHHRIHLSLGGGSHCLFPPVDQASLSPVGERMKMRGAKISYFAAGPIAQVILSALCLKVALTFWDKIPDLGWILAFSAVHSLGNLFHYAYTGLSSDQVGHDFADLRKEGVHPAASMAAIVAVAALCFI